MTWRRGLFRVWVRAQGDSVSWRRRSSTAIAGCLDGGRGRAAGCSLDQSVELLLLRRSVFASPLAFRLAGCFEEMPLIAGWGT